MSPEHREVVLDDNDTLRKEEVLTEELLTQCRRQNTILRQEIEEARETNMKLVQNFDLVQRALDDEKRTNQEIGFRLERLETNLFRVLHDHQENMKHVTSIRKNFASSSSRAEETNSRSYSDQRSTLGMEIPHKFSFHRDDYPHSSQGADFPTEQNSPFATNHPLERMCTEDLSHNSFKVVGYKRRKIAPSHQQEAIQPMCPPSMIEKTSSSAPPTPPPILSEPTELVPTHQSAARTDNFHSNIVNEQETPDLGREPTAGTSQTPSIKLLQTMRVEVSGANIPIAGSPDTSSTVVETIGSNTAAVTVTAPAASISQQASILSRQESDVSSPAQRESAPELADPVPGMTWAKLTVLPPPQPVIGYVQFGQLDTDPSPEQLKRARKVSEGVAEAFAALPPSSQKQSKQNTPTSRPNNYFREQRQNPSFILALPRRDFSNLYVVRHPRPSAVCDPIHSVRSSVSPPPTVTLSTTTGPTNQWRETDDDHEFMSD